MYTFFVNWLSGNSYRRAWVIWLVVTCFGGLYFLSYRGFPDSLDELAIFSANEGWAKADDPSLASLYHEYRYGGNPYILEAIPWQKSLHESLPVIWGGLLYKAIWPVDEIGLLHGIWLSNLWVTVAILATLAGLGMSLGYSEKTSLYVAFMIGLGTPLWHYSQTYFREPWAALWALLAYGTAIHLHRQRRWWLALLLCLWLFLALNSKIIILMLLPSLVLLLLPTLKSWQYAVLGLAGLVCGALLLVFFRDTVYRGRLLSLDGDYILSVFGAYFFSVGRSLWANSPILLLAFGGIWQHYRQKDFRLALGPLLFFFLLVANYAFSGRDWHGGRGWGSRYLIPVIPIMAILLFPAVENLAQKSVARWGLGILAFCSVLVQLGGVFAPLEPYYQIISQNFPENTLEGLYHHSTWEVNYAQWYLSLRYLPDHPLDVAWAYTDHAAAGLLLGLSLILLGGLGFWLRSKLGAFALLSLSLMTFGYGFALSQIQDDRRFLPRPELWALNAILEQEADSDSLIFFSDPQYRDFFLNYYRGQARFVTLPYAVGERYSFEQVPAVITDNPDERLDFQTFMPLWYGIQKYQTLWLVATQGPFHPWAYRPTEHYLARHFYPVQTWDLAADVRLIRFDTTPAIAFDESYQTLYFPDSEAIDFDEGLVLRGYRFPTVLQTGKVLPVSLKWQAESRIPFDYNVGVQLFDGAGNLVAQHDGQVQGGFGSMSAWEIGIPQADHHGILLPPDLPAGSYEIRVVVYDWRDGRRLGDLATIGRVQIR